MRIHDTNLNGAGATQLGRAQEAEVLNRGGRGRAGAAGSESGDRVQLSSLAGALSSEGADSPERMAMIEKLSADFRTGRYRPEAAEVSRRMVDEAMRDRF